MIVLSGVFMFFRAPEVLQWYGLMHSPLSFWVLLSAGVLGALDIVERRGRSSPLDPARQISISSLLESLPEAIFVVGRKGEILEVNQAAERLAGASKADMRHWGGEEIAKYVTDLNFTRPELSQLAVSRALRGETVQQERRHIRRPNGEEIEALVSANPIRDSKGEIVGALVIARDITELAQLQAHRAETEKHWAIGTMAASLTHDFNNVLDTISKAATLLDIAPDRPAEERAIVLRMIQNAVRRGAEIVANVRQYLIGAQAGSDLIDLNQTMEESLELTRPMWQAARPQISIVRQFQPVPAVRANAAEMRRIFTNLILNSIEAMPNGGTLVAGCEAGDGKVRAFVQDSGEGIPPERASKIFSPYFTTKQEGTGLGLSGAQKVLRSLGGQITFTSRPGECTRFVVELPAAQQDGQKAA